MANHWVCIDCGARQAAPGACAACRRDDTVDARDEKVRELMRDVDQELRVKRENRARLIGVLVGMTVVFALWLVPGYWEVEAMVRAPVFLDQWALMALIGFGAMLVLSRRWSARRFPYLRDDLALDE